MKTNLPPLGGEQFALVSGYTSDSTRKRKIELAVDGFIVTNVAIKINYKLITDSFDHIHSSNAADKIVLKTIYKDKHDKLYYKGAGQYSHPTTKASSNAKNFLNGIQLDALKDYIRRYMVHNVE